MYKVELSRQEFYELRNLGAALEASLARNPPQPASLTDLASIPPATRSELASGRPVGYTTGMKTAVSLPDDVFHAAERHARRQRKSRSQLYAEALTEYLERHAPDEVTEAMNQVVERLSEPGCEPFLAAAARRVFERTEW